MVKSKKSLAFCFSLTFISSTQAMELKGKLPDPITQLIIANLVRKSFEEYRNCAIEYHSEIDTDTNETLAMLETKIKVPKKPLEPLKFPSGTQMFRYKLLKAYDAATRQSNAATRRKRLRNTATRQKRPREDGQPLQVDSYTTLRIKKRSQKPLISRLLPIAIEEEQESTPKKNEPPPAKEIVGVTIMPQIEYERIKDRWVPKPPGGFYS